MGDLFLGIIGAAGFIGIFVFLRRLLRSPNYCTRCMNEIPFDIDVCPKCGHRIESANRLIQKEVEGFQELRTRRPKPKG